MSSEEQAVFFNKHPTFYPFRKILIERGYTLVFRPRDLVWKRFFSRLSLKANEKVLEVGCGTGVTLVRLEKSFKIKGWGIDVAGDSIKTAKTLGGRSEFLQGSATHLPFPDTMFDVVYSLDVLEHIKDQKKSVEEMVRVLKPGGRILIYTIYQRQRFTFNWFLNKLGVDVYASVMHDPKLFVDPAILKQVLEKKLVKVHEVVLYDAFFSLAVNFVMTMFLMLLPRLVRVKSSSLYLFILRILSVLSYVFVPITQVLDFPWLITGHANSFFIRGEKSR